MAKGGTLRIGLIIGTIVLAGVIYYLPKKGQPAPEVAESNTKPQVAAAYSVEDLIKESKTSLPWEQGNKISNLEEQIASDQNNLSLYDSIGVEWDHASRPAIAAWYFEKKAGINNAEKDWLNAAYRYFDAIKTARDSVQSQVYVSNAIRCYSKVIELNPANLDAKTDLGILYAEGTGEPMKGIMLLREVVTENPLHENAQMNLGFLSMKSGQFDKAVERFNRVLEINSSRIDMYVYLGEAFVRQGDKDKAIQNFEIFLSLSNDPEMTKDVEQYIAAIKSEKN